MQKIWIIAISALVVVAAVFALQSWRWNRAQRQRESNYQLALQDYRSSLASAAIRGDVERYLRSRQIQFQQLCCVDDEKSAYSDLVLIGKVNSPWYCSEHNVYIAFQFGASEGPTFRPQREKGLTA